MLSHDTKERQTGIVEIKEAEPTCIKKCIDFIYTGIPPDMDDDVEQLLYAAHLLQLTLLSDGIIKFLENELSLQSFHFTWKLANLYDSKGLVTKCNAFAEDNLEAITKMDEFGHFDKSFVEKMLIMKQVESFDASKLNALLRWIKFDLEKRKKHLNKMLKKISLSKVPAEYLRHLLENEPLISDDKERMKLFSLSALDNMSVFAKPLEDFQLDEAIAIFDRKSGYIQCFNPSKNIWTQMHEMNDDMKGSLFSAICIESFIYVFMDNQSVHRLNFLYKSAEWEHVGKTIDYHGLFPPVVAVKGCIYVVGGYGTATKTVEKFNIHSNKFTKLSDKQSEITASTVVVLNDKIYCCGGYVNRCETNEVECFDLKDSTWKIITPMNENKLNAAAVAFNGKIFILGGWSNNKKKKPTVECYVPTTDSWSLLATMNMSRCLFRCFAIRGCLYAVGGGDYKNTIEKYDHVKKVWTDIVLPTGLDLHVKASVKISLKS